IARLHRRGDGVARRLTLRTQPVDLADQAPALRIDRKRAVDQPRVLALRNRARANRLRILAQALEANAHGTASGAIALAASSSRNTTNARSRLASTQPARGPLDRPRNAVYTAPNASPDETPWTWPVVKMRSCH